MKTKDQIITKDYAIYNSDCMEVLPTLPDNSVDMSVYSPPFAGLYNYSSSDRDFSNCESKEQFLEQYEFLIEQIARVTKPGRVTAVHCTDVFDNSCRLWDFPHEIIRLHEKHGFPVPQPHHRLERAAQGTDAHDGQKPHAQTDRGGLDAVLYGHAGLCAGAYQEG